MDSQTFQISTSQLSRGLSTFQTDLNGGSVIKYIYSIFVVLFVALAFPRFTWADDLTGRVLDPQGNRVADAQLRLFDRKSGELRSTRSSSAGEFTFTAVPAGEYLLEAEASSAALTG